MNPVRIYREIRKVGIKDWIYFVIILKRDEFSPKLYLNHYLSGREKTSKDFDNKMKKYGDVMSRVHKIEMELSEIR